MRFTHTGEEKFTVDRPAVKAGGFRLGRAVTETHEVESLSDAPTDFLRIELKTVAADSQKFRGRYPPEAHPTDRNSQQARFDNGQVRILRVTCAARSKCGPYRLATPSLWVAITPARLKMSGKTRAASDLEMESGQTLWVEPGDLLRLENIGAAPAEFLRLELKTKPAGNS